LPINLKKEVHSLAVFLMRKRHGAFKGKENVGRVLVLYTCSTKWVITAIIKNWTRYIGFLPF